MTGSDRRGIMRMIGVIAAVPLLPAPLRAAPRGPVTFPHRPCTLERVLERQLGDGALIRVTRRWECRFEPLGAGARVVARQLSARVDAPESLAALASLEERREARDMFPAQLDRHGILVGWEASPAENVDEAVARALRLIEASLPNGEERREARRFLAGISSGAANFVSRAPQDLFFPVAGRTSQSMPIELEGELQGFYEVAIEALARPTDGLLDCFDRQVVTTIAETRRMTRETWKMDPDEV